MISELAIEDAEELRREGVEVTDRDIIRMNAFALKIERSAFCAEWFAMPRVAFIGDVAIREPTIGHELWIREAGRRFDLSNPETAMLVWSYALARPCDDLPNPYARFLETRMRWFARRRLGKATMRQLSAALGYAIEGNVSTDGEDSPAKPGQSAGTEAERRETSIALGVLHDGIEYRIGSPSELRGMTRSEVAAIVALIRLHKGETTIDAVKSNAQGGYFAVLDEIRERGRAAK